MFCSCGYRAIRRFLFCLTLLFVFPFVVVWKYGRFGFFVLFVSIIRSGFLFHPDSLFYVISRIVAWIKFVFRDFSGVFVPKKKKTTFYPLEKSKCINKFPNENSNLNRYETFLGMLSNECKCMTS